VPAPARAAAVAEGFCAPAAGRVVGVAEVGPAVAPELAGPGDVVLPGVGDPEASTADAVPTV